MVARRFTIVYLTVMTALLIPCGSSWGSPLDTWHWRHPYPQGLNLRGIAYGNGLYVAVGDEGTIITSPDGSTWTVVAPVVSGSLWGAAHGNGRFVVVGNDGVILTSPDGTNWTSGPRGDSTTWHGAAYANGLFFIVGSEPVSTRARIMTSADGISWVERSAGFGTPRAVTYGKGRYVAVGSYEILISSDAVSWAEVPSGDLSGVAFGNELFVAVGSNGGVYISEDGETWTRQDPFPHYAGLRNVGFGNGVFVAVASEGGIYTSLNGTEWTQRYSPVQNSLASVTSGPGGFVAAGDSGTILRSPDGVEWEETSSGTNLELASVAYGNHTYVAVGYYALNGGGGAILTSGNGREWTEQVSERLYDLKSVAYGAGMYAAVGLGGVVLASRDGRDWIMRLSPTYRNLLSITYGGGLFVTVDEYGYIYTSRDLLSWTERLKGSYLSLRSVTYGDGLFIAVGKAGIYTSSDGMTWTKRNFESRLHGVSHGESLFVAVGEGGKIFTSKDGITWTVPLSVTPRNLLGVSYGEGVFVAVGEEGILLVSVDGATWNEISSGTSETLKGVSYGDGAFWAAGSSGTILSSEDGYSWDARTSGISNELSGVAWGEAGCVVVGYKKILATTDGIVWNEKNYPMVGRLNRVSYGNGIFVAVGEAGTILTSPDGATWTERTTGTTSRLFGAVYGKGVFVVFGEKTILTSPDGATWTAVPGITHEGFDVAYGNGVFVLAGAEAILTSSDGLTWVKSEFRPSESGQFRGIAFGNGMFILTERWPSVVVIGLVHTSVDGMTWSSTGIDFPPGRIGYGGGTFIAVGGSGSIFTSPCGTIWTERHGGVSFDLREAAFGDEGFVVAGESGTILQSDPVILAPEVTASKTIVKFGYVNVGGSSAPQAITVSSAGGADLAIGPITIEGPNASEFEVIDDTCSAQTWSPCWGCTVKVVFSPLSSGPRKAVLSIPSNDPATNPLIIQLDGKGDQSEIHVDSTHLDFGDVAKGQSSQRSIVVRSEGSAALHIASISAPTPPFARIGGDCMAGAILPRGGSCSIAVSFAPVGAGSFSSALHVRSDDLDEPEIQVVLTGTSGADFTGKWVSLDQNCKTTAMGESCQINGVFLVENQGVEKAPSTPLRFFVSEDDTLDDGDLLLKQVATGGVMANGSKQKKLSYRLPAGQKLTGKYIIAVVDQDDQIQEIDEGNNIAVWGPVP